MGDQSDPWWIRVGLHALKHDVPRFELCSSGRKGAHQDFWKATKRLWLRPRGLECRAQKGNPQTWRRESGYSSQGQSPLGCGSPREGPNGSRASPDRGKNRHDETQGSQQVRSKTAKSSANVGAQGRTLPEFEALCERFVNGADGDGSRYRNIETALQERRAYAEMWINKRYPQEILGKLNKSHDFLRAISRTAPN